MTHRPLSSIKTVMEEYLGRRWPLALALLAVFVLWPLPAFWGGLSFQPHRFTEEWLKLSVNGLVLFLVLETFRARSASTRQARVADQWVAESLDRPLTALCETLAGVPAARDDLQRQKTAQDIEANWCRLREAVQGGAGPALLKDEAGEAFRRAVQQLDPVRCDSLVQGLLPGGLLGSASNPVEFDELRARLGAFAAAVKTLEPSRRR